MKAIRWHAREDIRYEDVPEPTPGPGQVKAKIHYTGICGSDLHEYEAGPIFIPLTPHPVTGSMAPIILGHEFTGKVVELGEGVAGFNVGDRVTGDCLWICGECYYCMRSRPSLCPSQAATGLSVDGSMTEYMVAPAYTFYKLPESVSDEIGVLVEPLSVAFHAIRQGKLHVGDSVAIVGAGQIGCSVILAAKVAGASKIYVVEYSNGRREMAMEMGATMAIDPAEGDPVQTILDLTGGLGADVSFDCAGQKSSPPIALQCARPGGTVVIVGIFAETSPIHFNDVVFGERNIVGCAAYAYETSFVIDMIANGTIQPSTLITGKIELKDVEKRGFKELIKNKDRHLKIIVESPNWI